METYFKLNQPQVACEELSGDLMILHFGSGLYYNLCGVGADVCSFLLAGGAQEEAASSLARHFEIDVQKALQDTVAFVTQLIQEGLLVVAEKQPYTKPMRITAKIYEPPQFQKFDDMADQLLLDKIDDQSPSSQDSAL